MIYSARSQNGRWGFDVISSTHEPSNRNDGRKRVLQGTAEPLGKLNGVQVLEVVPAEGTWTLLDKGNNSYTALSGAVVIHSVGLQGGNHGSVVVLQEGAVLRVSGYDDRNRWFERLTSGRLSRLSEGDAYILGIA